MTRVVRFSAVQELVLSVNKDVATVSSKPKAKGEHNPTRFRHDTQLLIARGMNILNCWSPTTMAAWIYHGNRAPDRVEKQAWAVAHPPQKYLRDTLIDATKLQHNDTLFVSMSRLQEFVHNFLPLIQVDIVLIATPWYMKKPPPWVGSIAPNITDNTHILAWFTTNIGNYTGGKYDHEKVHAFPLGLKPHVGPATHRRPIPFFRKVFLEHWNKTNTPTSNQTHGNDSPVMYKTDALFVSPVRPTHADRQRIVPPPSRQIMEYTDYLQRIATAHYVFSPNGDHPDCHRHYEAIGLGAIPVTQLNEQWYDFFEPGSVIYSNTEWNTTRLVQNQQLLAIPPSRGQPNRNQVFEEYWMEYVERRVGRPLVWWDVISASRAPLLEFATQSATPPHVLPADD